MDSPASVLLSVGLLLLPYIFIRRAWTTPSVARKVAISELLILMAAFLFAAAYSGPFNLASVATQIGVAIPLAGATFAVWYLFMRVRGLNHG